MKKFDTIQKTYEEQALISTTCDICKKTCKGSSWSSNIFEDASVNVSMCVNSSNFAYGDIIVNTEFDICPQCFKEKLIPFLKSLGAEPTETEESW